MSHDDNHVTLKDQILEITNNLLESANKIEDEFEEITRQASWLHRLALKLEDRPRFRTVSEGGVTPRGRFRDFPPRTAPEPEPEIIESLGYIEFYIGDTKIKQQRKLHPLPQPLPDAIGWVEYRFKQHPVYRRKDGSLHIKFPV